MRETDPTLPRVGTDPIKVWLLIFEGKAFLHRLCLRISNDGRQRQENRKTTSLTELAFDGDGSLVSFDNVLDQR
jgi:hypothetical protein